MFFAVRFEPSRVTTELGQMLRLVFKRSICPSIAVRRDTTLRDFRDRPEYST